MVLLETKSKSSSSPLSLVTSNSKGKISFSDLLKGVSEKNDNKLVQNGSLILSLGSEEKSVKSTKETLKTDKVLSLLKNEDTLTTQKEKESLELNPKLVEILSKEDIKSLVADAKNYLKAKIEDSQGYKKAEIKELPKTLNGLIDAAKKFGIDVEKISIEEVRGNLQDKKALHVKDDMLTKTKDDIPTKDILEDKKVITAKENFIPKESLQDKKSIEINNRQLDKESLKNDEKSLQVKKETPIFKAQATLEHATTQQIVQAKSNNLLKSEQKTEKSKADETLKLLLRNEKPSDNSTLTADFSVATAKVIAPSGISDTMKSLEKLLHGDSSLTQDSDTAVTKLDSSTVHKADSFEVKLNEAKQMIKYLSADIKGAIDDYKSPFTRVKVQLNPQHLGEVDLTVVQRGKNLHVNITSNNAALNMLAMNSNELKTQLNNSGINNATLNFSDNSQNGNTNGGEHQKRENEQRAEKEYNYFENEDISEEILSSLEIVVPRYI